ncbi:MAG: exodeoxyribonuclease III [Saccharofermentans sp.]|nr:exodeoxyribonuclease III [Saccharofermentans sp.]
MRLVSWNVNGIRAVAGKDFLGSFESMKPDILGIQEIKALPEQVPSEIANIPGYKSVFYPAEKKGYSGTGLFYREDLTPKITLGFGVEEFDHEGRVIKADFGDFVLFNIYFPNGGRGDDFVQFKLRFYDCFLDQVKELEAQGKQVICCGDVNTAHKEIDLSNPKANSKISGFLPEERAYMDKFIEKGLTDTFRMLHPDEAEKYSWWSYKTYARERNVGWRIDYFFVTEGLKSKVAQSDMMSDIFGSDHCPIYIDLDI